MFHLFAIGELSELLNHSNYNCEAFQFRNSNMFIKSFKDFQVSEWTERALYSVFKKQEKWSLTFKH